MSSTSSLAPPCSGPVRVPMAAPMTLNGSASVEPVTRALNVEAFIVCSACRIRQALEEVLEPVLDTAVVDELVLEADQLLLRGQTALEQQPGGLLEVTLAGQRLGRDTAVFQPGALPIDEADRRFRDRHVRKSR